MRFRERRLLVALTSSVSTVFVEGQLGHLRGQGWEVDLVASPDQPGRLEAVARAEGATAHALPMARPIRPLADARSLVGAVRLLRRVRPLVTNVGTPKAGLVVGLAALLTGVPHRVYTVHGLRYEGEHGARRAILRWTERVAAACAHQVVCVSPSVAEAVVAQRLAPPARTVVLGAGSVNGVVLPEPWDDGPRPAGVIGYVGRLARDKGVDDLVAAFVALAEERPGLRLLLCGEVDPGDPPGVATLATLRSHPRIDAVGHVSPVAPSLRAMSVLALPSYREGLPGVLLEAAAHGLPVVTTTATGCRDAVVDGWTGVTVAPGDRPALRRALADLLDDDARATAMGEAGRAHVAEHFRREDVWQRWVDLYAGLPAQPRPSDRVKRGVDLVVGAAALVVAAPVLAVSAAVVWRSVGRPVLFRQQRPGRHGRLFAVVKLRTMSDARGEDGRLLGDGERVTPVGAWLRRTSLDELPSLWNVVRGDMSLVGPRPLLPRYLPHYTFREAARHAVRPGLTGWAQVNGRNETGWAERLEQDVWYVERRSLRLDLLILWRTVGVVLRRAGVVVDQRALMPDLDEERLAA